MTKEIQAEYKLFKSYCLAEDPASLPATSSSLLLLTCHLLTGNDFVIENLSQADATATKHVAPQMPPPRRPQLGQIAKIRQKC